MTYRTSEEPEPPKKIASYTVKLDAAQLAKLRGILEAKGWTPFEVAYTHFAFRADHLKVNVSAYTSGKVVVAGKGTEDFVRDVIEPEVDYFAGSKTEPREQQQNRVIASSERGPTIACLEHTLHLIGRKMFRQRGQFPPCYFWHRHREVLRMQALVVQVTKEGAGRGDELARIGCSMASSVSLDEGDYVTRPQPLQFDWPIPKLLGEQTADEHDPTYRRGGRQRPSSH